MLPLSHPQPGEPFADSAIAAGARRVGALTLPAGGMQKEFTFVQERMGERLAVCLFIVAPSGRNPYGYGGIEGVASDFYNTLWGIGAVGRHASSSEPYYEPERLDIYLYRPPQASRDEKFLRLRLQWDDTAFAFRNPGFEQRPAVPYFLRKYAATRGWAPDPDAAPVRLPVGRRRGPFGPQP